MKTIFATLLTLVSFQGLANCPALTAADGHTSYPWGARVDVAYHGNVSFFLSTQASEFEVEAASYGSFECDVKVIQLNTCVEVIVDWSPGSDLSGCELTLTADGANLGTSELYMNY